MEYDNKNRGAFFKNAKKETEKHPDYTGSLNVEGVEYWISGWRKKEDASAKAPLMSFSIKRKEEKAPAKSKFVANKDEPFDSFDNDLPF